MDTRIGDIAKMMASEDQEAEGGICGLKGCYFFKNCFWVNLYCFGTSSVWMAERM